MASKSNSLTKATSALPSTFASRLPLKWTRSSQSIPPEVSTPQPSASRPFIKVRSIKPGACESSTSTTRTAIRCVSPRLPPDLSYILSQDADGCALFPVVSMQLLSGLDLETGEIAFGAWSDPEGHAPRGITEFEIIHNQTGLAGALDIQAGLFPFHPHAVPA